MSKKGSKAQPKEQSYEVRDIVLAKVRGYPPWPGIVSTSSLPLCPCARGVPDTPVRRTNTLADILACLQVVDPDAVPKHVAKERPNAKSKKGNWYCVRFFPAGD